MGKSKEAEEMGRRVAALRNKLGLSQPALAKLSGYASQQNISSIEAGDTEHPGRLLDLARALRTTPEYLRAETDDPHPPEVVTNDATLSELDRELSKVLRDLPDGLKPDALSYLRFLSSREGAEAQQSSPQPKAATKPPKSPRQRRRRRP